MSDMAYAITMGGDGCWPVCVAREDGPSVTNATWTGDVFVFVFVFPAVTIIIIIILFTRMCERTQRSVIGRSTNSLMNNFMGIGTTTRRRWDGTSGGEDIGGVGGG